MPPFLSEYRQPGFPRGRRKVRVDRREDLRGKHQVEGPSVVLQVRRVGGPGTGDDRGIAQNPVQGDLKYGRAMARGDGREGGGARQASLTYWAGEGPSDRDNDPRGRSPRRHRVGVFLGADRPLPAGGLERAGTNGHRDAPA